MIPASPFEIALIDSNGSVAARAPYHMRTAVQAPPGVPVFNAHPVSASNTRVYFLDGDTDVRSLSPDGTVALVAHLPGGPSVRSVFAVSPDDRRIAVSVLDYSASPPKLRLYVEDLDTGANHVEIFSSTSLFVWPVGWHSCELVVGLGERPLVPNGLPPFNPYGASSYQLIDAANGTRLATIGDALCTPTGPLSPMGTACIQGGMVSVLGWDGRPIVSGLAAGCATPWAAAAEPSGTKVAVYCSPEGLFVNDGGTLSNYRGWGAPLWIDARHILAPAIDAVVDLGTRQVTPYDASGYVYGRIPGSL